MSGNNCLCEWIAVNHLIHNNEFALTVICNEWVSGNDCLGEWMSALIHSHPFTKVVIRNKRVREWIPSLVAIAKYSLADSDYTLLYN